MNCAFRRWTTRGALGLAGALLSVACSPAPQQERVGSDPTHDPRTAVPLPAHGQEAVLGEMRQLLGAIGGAMSAAARADTLALIAALAPAGSAAAADHELEELLPAEWKELAERTHGGFDSLTVAVRRAPNAQAVKDTVLVGIARISASCTACHEKFRVWVR
ncbi:MAG: hypothetical protein IT359_01185 [Gemmatimonadaceae bacterium]|nr:hypothetical protein [Gemmatimonadaceae bacterium]